MNLEKKGTKVIANIDIDQVISLCNLKTKKWNRIFFGALSSPIEEATWISNTKFILVGYEMNGNNDHYPKIYIGDTGKQQLFVYTNSDSTCVENKTGYSSKKLDKIKFEE